MGLGRYKVVVALDSNVFIAFFEQDNEFYKASAEIMKAIESGLLSVTYSALVYGEVMRMPHGNSLEPIGQFFDNLNGQDYPADRVVCSKAAELRHTYSALKLPDAIHLASALIARADIFITADKRLLAIALREMSCTYLKDFQVNGRS